MTLRRLLTLEYGASLPDGARQGDAFPVFGSNGEVGRHRRFNVSGPGIVVGRKGSVGAVRWSEEPFWAIDTTYFVTPKPGTDLRWCYWILASLPLPRLDSSTGVPGLNREDVYRLQVVVPHTPTQHRIAEILDAADAAVQRTEVLMSKRLLARVGLVHDLFSRGVTDDGQLRPWRDEAPALYKHTAIGWTPKDWEVVTLRRCLVDAPTNGIYKPAKLIGRGTLVVGQTAVTPERSIDFNLARRAVVFDEELRRYGLAESDILISRVFATVDGVGQPALVPRLSEPAVYESNMMRLRIDRSTIQPRLLFEWLRSDTARRRIAAGANSSNQSSINQKVLNDLPVVRPMPREQERLVALVEAFDRSTASELASLAKLRHVGRGLMDDLLTARVPVSV